MDFKALRAKRNDKARSLIESSGGKVDSSDWTPDEPLNADAKTGMRPISRRAFKAGGKVEGEKAKTNLSRAPRGFQEKVGLANTNQKDANEEREGVKHVGGFKRGGRTGYQTYGAVDGARLDTVGPDEGGEKSEPMTTNNGRKVSAKQEAGFNEAQKQQAAWEAEQRAKGDMTRRKDGGRTAKASGGSFKGAFAAARKQMGAGKTFDWNGKSYSTNYAEEEKTKPAIMAPTTSPMPPKRPVANVMQPAKITASPLPEDTAAAAMKAFSRPEGMPSVDVMGNATGYKKGGMAKKFEGSAKDEAQDKKLAAKRKMTMAEWEASKADEKHDKQQSMKGLKAGGRAGKMGGGEMAAVAPVASKMVKDPKKAIAGGLLAGLKAGGKADEDHDKDCACKACGGRMARATGGRAGKGKTNIVINVMPHTANKPAESIQPPMPPMPPVGGPPPMGAMPPPRMSLPPGLGAAMAGAAGAGPMPPQGGAGPMPPMMGRKDGGKVYPKMKFGAGSGKGRLEKIEKYGKNA